MSDAFVESPAEQATTRLQIIAAVLLGLAATLTAISGYLASLEDGTAADAYARSNSLTSEANGFYNEGDQLFAQDQTLFAQYATAANLGQDDLSAYLLTLMRPSLQEAIDWWANEPDDRDIATPFDDIEDNPYLIEPYGDGDDAKAKAEAAYKEATVAGEKGDKLGLSTVLFALTLFFGGIATLFSRRVVTNGLLGVAAVTLVIGVVQFGTALGS